MRVAAGAHVRISGDGTCEVSGRAATAAGGPLLLALLADFAAPRRVADVLRERAATAAGTRGAVELLDALSVLWRCGAVVSADGDGFADDPSRDGFGAAALHAAMLADRNRTTAWLQAVRAAVRAGDVVLDIGTGTGILAIAAAQAGARRVFAVEASSCAGVAERMAQENGVADRVEIVRGWSTQVELPERADVVVSEVLGDDPFAEGVLEIVTDALRRLAKPDARVVPSGVKLWGALVEIPEEDLRRHVFTAASVAELGAAHGLSFEPLLQHAPAGVTTSVGAATARRWTRRGPPVVLASAALDGTAPEHIRATATLEAASAGPCHGALTYFEAELDAHRTVTTDPSAIAGATHWKHPVLVFPVPRVLAAGDRIPVEYQHPGAPALAVARA